MISQAFETSSVALPGDYELLHLKGVMLLQEVKQDQYSNYSV
jgi:hypothetical protein